MIKTWELNDAPRSWNKLVCYTFTSSTSPVCWWYIIFLMRVINSGLVIKLLSESFPFQNNFLKHQKTNSGFTSFIPSGCYAFIPWISACSHSPKAFIPPQVLDVLGWTWRGLESFMNLIFKQGILFRYITEMTSPRVS